MDVLYGVEPGVPWLLGTVREDGPTQAHVHQDMAGTEGPWSWGTPTIAIIQLGILLKGAEDKAAATAKSLQLCSTLCDPIDGSPPGSPVPGVLQARILEWVAFPSPMHESEK